MIAIALLQFSASRDPPVSILICWFDQETLHFYYQKLHSSYYQCWKRFSFLMNPRSKYIICLIVLYNIKVFTVIFDKLNVLLFIIFIWPSNSSTLYSNSIVSISVFFLYIYKIKRTHLTLYQLHIYSLTAILSWKTNTSFVFFLVYILVSLKKHLAICTALG